MDFVIIFSLFSLWMNDIPQTCFEFETDNSSLQVAYNNNSKMSIEASWVIKLLWLILMLAIFFAYFLILLRTEFD